MSNYLDFRTKLEDAETALGIVRRDVDLLSEKEVPALIKDSAAHQVTKILRGDYDLKIARQDYFVSNQDKVFRDSCFHCFNTPRGFFS